jgi:hypothetical protein
MKIIFWILIGWVAVNLLAIIWAALKFIFGKK